MPQQNCSTTKINTGRPDCSAKYGFPVGGILTPRGTQIATKTLVQTESTWTALFNAALSTRTFPVITGLDNLKSFEPTNDDPVFVEGLNGVQFKARDGNRRLKFIYADMPDCWLDGPGSLENSKWDVWLIMSNDYIRSWTPDGTIRQGYKCKVHAGNRIFAANGDETEDYDFYIDFLDPKKLRTAPRADECTETTGDFFATELDGIINVDITEVSTTGETAVTIDVKTECGENGVPDLDAGPDDDFVILDSGGSEVAISASTESTTVPGRYVVEATLTAATFTINLRNQPAMTVKGYESNAALSFTTSA